MSNFFYSEAEKKTPSKKHLEFFDALRGLTGFHLAEVNIQHCCANIYYTQNQFYST